MLAGFPERGFVRGDMEIGNGDTPSLPFGPQREATIPIIIFSSPVTLTGLDEKKTGPSRFRSDF